MLNNYIDRRVTLKGAFDRLTNVPGRQYKAALIQDATVSTDQGDIDIGHTWIQDADTFAGFDLDEGDRFTCSVRVVNYKKNDEVKIGFRYPTEIVRVNRLCALRIPRPTPEYFERDANSSVATPPIDATNSPAQFLAKLQKLIEEAGGWDQFNRIVKMAEGFKTL